MDFPDEEVLQNLHAELPFYCMKSKSDNTAKQYRYAFNIFCKWCNNFKTVISSLPASDTHVAMYLIHLAKTSKSASKIQCAIHAISWAHNLAGIQDPCESSLVQSVKEGVLRECSKPVVKKEPVTPEILNKIVDKFASKDASLSDLRTATICLLGYSGFLRFSEIANLKRANISIQDDHMTLNIVKSKTDVYNEGNKVVFARTLSKSCPVNMLERYLDIASIKSDVDEFIFRSLSYCKNADSYKLRNADRPLSYTRAREIILSAFDSIGLESSKFGIHSLRSGVPLLPQISALTTAFSKKNTGGGNPTKLKTVMLKKASKKNFLFQRI